MQHQAGADRTLLPGVYIPWDKHDTTGLSMAVAEQGRLATSLDAGLLVAVDSRWVAKQPQLVCDALLSTGRPAALVLTHQGDPLSVSGAAAGLRLLAQRIPGPGFLPGAAIGREGRQST